MLWNNKIRGKIWRLIKEINSNLTAKCKGSNTESQQIKRDSNLRQGGVLSVTIFANMMDCLSEGLIKEKEELYMEIPRYHAPYWRMM